jgi:hypothetical protein
MLSFHLARTLRLQGIVSPVALPSSVISGLLCFRIADTIFTSSVFSMIFAHATSNSVGVPIASWPRAGALWPIASNTDCDAIFGSQFTPLRHEVRVEFPQHGEAIKRRSEEEVAAAQLRLIKGYVDVHTEELFRLWESNRAEPDWFAGVVRPVVKLFQGWRGPAVRSRFFADREAFLKLVA